MKRIFVVIATVLLSNAGIAQNFYFRGGLGYAFPQAGQSADGSGVPFNGSVNASSSVQTYSIKSASFSAGVQGIVGFGYMINNNIGIQLDAHLGLAPKKYSFHESNVDLGSGVMGEVIIGLQANAPMFLVPSIVLQAGNSKINPYARFGPALPVSTSMTLKETIKNYPGAGAVHAYDFTFDIKNSFSLGFAGAAGVKYSFNDRVSMWAEASLLSCSVFINKAELNSITDNGANVPLAAYSGNQIVNFTKSASVDSSGATQVAYTHPFSNVAINIGVCVNLGKGGSRNRHREPEPGKPFRRR